MVIRLVRPVKTALMILPLSSEFGVIINTFFSDTYCDVSFGKSNWSVETTESIVLSHSCFSSVHVECFMIYGIFTVVALA